MGTAVEYGQVQNLILIDAGVDATWAFSWDFDAAHYASLDPGLMRYLIPDPANPGLFIPQTIEILRAWVELDDTGQEWRFYTFRNPGPQRCYLLPNLIRANRI